MESLCLLNEGESAYHWYLFRNVHPIHKRRKWNKKNRGRLKISSEIPAIVSKFEVEGMRLKLGWDGCETSQNQS